MIAVDTNMLVYAHRRDSPWHSKALTQLTTLMEGSLAWAIPWPCIHEFLGIVTHPRIYKPASTIEEAIDQVEAWFESPTVVTIGEGGDYWGTLRSMLSRARVAGPKVHDARIAALCKLHGVTELLSADRDFSRFPLLRTRNPLIE